MLDQTVRTQHVTQYSWRAWKPGGDIPDLSPGSVEGNLLLSIRDATEMAAGDVLGPKVRKAEANGVAYTGPRCLDELYETAFTNLDTDAMKSLKKVFDTVMKNYYTVIFTDPQGNNQDFLAYASPGMYYDLEALVKQQASSDIQADIETLQARMEKLKGNACKKSGGAYLCNQPVSGRTTCTHWEAPEEGNRFQCYYQERNPSQVGVSDCFLCQCEEAWKECDPDYQAVDTSDS